MVYERPDGTKSFSWQKQLNFLKREQSDDLENIIHTKLMLLKKQHPEKADYYEDLDYQLSNKINDAVDKTPTFNFDDAQAITRAFLVDNDLASLLEDEETTTYSHWCYRCEDFTSHQPMENGNTYCVTCHRERESALTRSLSTMAEKRPNRESRRYLVRGCDQNCWYYLNHQNRWTQFQQDAKQFKEKREALEAFETTPRPSSNFAPEILTIDERDQDFTIVDDEDEAWTLEEQEVSEFLTALQDFEEWEPQSPEKTTCPITTPCRWGERHIPGIAELHDAIAGMANPDGTFQEEGDSSDDL